MKVLVTGAHGMLGRAVGGAAPESATLVLTSRATLDITDEPAVRRAMAERPGWVINCAGYTRVDDAEAHEREATRVNGEAVGMLGRTAADFGVRVLHVSTDYVFDGRLGRPYREDDAPNPINAYGRSKLAGEHALAASGCQWTVVRTQWLYGGGASFVRTMWRKARERRPARVVNDQLGAPTHCGELAAMIWRLIADGRHGVWHAAAGGLTSWYEVARVVYAEADADAQLVEPCGSAEYAAAALRPLDTRLDTARLGAMRPWDEVLHDVLARARDAGVEP